MKVRQNKTALKAFRCNENIMNMAINKADNLGITLSEYLRYLILQDLDLVNKNN